MPAQEGTYTAPDGNAIAYQVWGSEHDSGTPLVLVTGLSALMDDWRPFVDLLCKKRKVLLLDHRGMGASRLPKDWDEDHSLDLEARDVLAVLRHLGSKFQKVDILGWSMGGQITQVLLTLPEAKEHPKGGLEVQGIHINKAILAATMTKLPKGDFKPQVLEEVMASAESDPNWKTKMVKVMMEYQYDPEWIHASSKNQQLLESRVEKSVNSRRPQKIIAMQGASIAQVDTRPDLPRIPASLPVLIIHGRLDRMVAYSESEHIVKNIAHAKRFDPGTNGDRYGHFWFDYFETSWWADRINTYLSEGDSHKARL
ncbi:hypothetical protein CBS101457_004542 [Exobasidium rhododendri]|nr:hypothetical protein CBS101457_004542 [Exobasidium rhododendri]